MASERYEDCFIYVRGADDRAALCELLQRFLGATAELWTLTLTGFEIDIRKNKRRQPQPEDDFVNWPTMVEVYADASTSDREMVDLTSRLMVFLRSSGFPNVAACDFEDELPQLDYVRDLPPP